MKKHSKPSNRWLYPVALAAFLLGVLLGKLAPGIFPPIAFLGESYIKLLKLVVIPIMMTQIITGVYRASRDFAGRLVKTVGLFVAMFVVSFSVTALFATLLGPGRGVNLFGESFSGTLAAATLPDFIKSILPDNILAAMAAGSILPCTIFAFVFGIAAARVGAENTIKVLDETGKVFIRILEYIMYFTPVGVFSLMGSAVAAYGTGLLGTAGRYILTAWAGCVLVTLLAMVLPVWLYAKIPPLTYLQRAGKVWLVTLSTCSSAAALPHTMKVCNESFGVPEEITGVVVPLGCTIHMCGGAVSFCLLGLFTLQMAQIPLTFGLFCTMLLVATLMNMAAPGIPGGGIVLGATYLTILGAPTGFIGVYSGIYRLLDMAYTTLNVTGDITANVLLHAHETRGAGKAPKNIG